MMTVAPVSSWIRSMISMAFFPVAGSRFASGSSNNKMLTSLTITPAMETRCFWPPERASGECSRWSPMPTWRATCLTVFFISSCPTQAFSNANAMSSATVRPMNCPSRSCRTVPTILEISKMLKCFVSFPWIVSFPVDSPGYANGISPFMQWVMVDFPQPDGPAIRIFSPG